MTTQELRECQICYTEEPLDKITKIDNKYHDICIKCFQNYIIFNAQEGNVLELKCPHCSLRLKYSFIRNILPKEEFPKFLAFLKSKVISIDPQMRWCPNSKCAKPINLPEKFKRKEQCDECKSYLCTKCNSEYHSGSCTSHLKNEREKWDDNKNMQNCPACRTIVTKISGCNHMTCQVCKYNWCWICKRRYTNNHFYRFNPFGCPYMQYCDSLWKLIILRFFQLLLIPLVLIFGAPVFVCKYVREEIHPRGCKKVFVYPLAFLLGLILQPIADAIIAIGIVPFGIVYLIRYYIKSRKCKKLSLANQNQNTALMGLGISKVDLELQRA